MRTALSDVTISRGETYALLYMPHCERIQLAMSKGCASAGKTGAIPISLPVVG